MKVLIRDRRAKPRVIYIDGHKFVLPCNKEVLMDIKEDTCDSLRNLSYLTVSEYEEMNDTSISESVSTNEQEIDNESIHSESNNDPVVNTDVAPVQESINEIVDITPDTVDEIPMVDMSSDASDRNITETMPQVDYSSMTKKALRSLIEEKGGDATGMTKSNMIDWLNANV